MFYCLIRENTGYQQLNKIKAWINLVKDDERIYMQGLYPETIAVYKCVPITSFDVECSFFKNKHILDDSNNNLIEFSSEMIIIVNFNKIIKILKY